MPLFKDVGSVDRLMAELDGARFVKYDPDGLVWAWFGGHGVHAYDATGREVDYCTVGDWANDHATLLEVEKGINEYIAGL